MVVVHILVHEAPSIFSQEMSMSMSHSRHDPQLGPSDVPRDGVFDGLGGHRHLLGHAVVTVVLLIALMATVAWLLLT